MKNKPPNSAYCLYCQIFYYKACSKLAASCASTSDEHGIRGGGIHGVKPSHSCTTGWALETRLARQSWSSVTENFLPLPHTTFTWVSGKLETKALLFPVNSFIIEPGLSTSCLPSVPFPQNINGGIRYLLGSSTLHLAIRME